jgi:hypothetical protein
MPAAEFYYLTPAGQALESGFDLAPGLPPRTQVSKQVLQAGAAVGLPGDKFHERSVGHRFII